MTTYLIAILCVFGLAVGQILFKVGATALTQTGSFLDPKVATSLLAAMCLYGVTSLAWVWVLQRIELGRVYPLMALAFVLVPLGSHLMFGEKFSLQYFAGVFLIMLGIIVISKA